MPRANIPPWLHPIGMPAADFEALIFRTSLAMRLPLVGVARRHLERAYPVTSVLLEAWEERDDYRRYYDEYYR